VKEAVARGAQVHTGAKYDGQIYYPTILTNVPLDAVIANEETSGRSSWSRWWTRPGRRDCRRKSHNVRPHVFDSRREYLQGIRDGAEGFAESSCKFTTVNDEIHAPMGGVRDSGWGGRDPQPG